MKNVFTNKFIPLLVGVFLTFMSVQTSAQIGITFSFANGQITSSGPDKFFEFDIMAVATANSQFKLAQLYIIYNTVGFGSNIVGNGNVTVTKGELLNDVGISDPGQSPVPFDGGSYSIDIQDNTSSLLSIQNYWTEFDPDGDRTGFDLTNTLGTTPKVYVHVKIKIADENEQSGLSFDNTVSQFDQQQYYFSSGDTHINYSPVNVGADLNVFLPVELSTFTATPNKNAVELKWQTTTEVDNYGFEVERALFSTSSIQAWQKIGFIPGSGNSNSPKNYSFTDKNPVGGKKFIYRLKQIDNSGKYEYSNEVEVEFVPSEFALYQNYPNPFNPATTIKFAMAKAGRVNLTVYNLVGEKVTTLLDENRDAGFYTIEFNASKLASGIYIYRMTTSDFVQTKKFTLLK